MINKLSKLMEEAGRHFAKDGRLARWYPLYEAFDSFLFGSNEKTARAPHIRDSIDLKRIMTTVLIALLPCVVMAMWNTGYQANLVICSHGPCRPGRLARNGDGPGRLRPDQPDRQHGSRRPLLSADLPGDHARRLILGGAVQPDPRP